MILQRRSLTLAEVKENIPEANETKVMHDYLKMFCKLSNDKAQKMIEELQALNNPKMKEEYLVKTVDMLPADAEELHKIFVDVSLSEEESNAILGIVKKY